MSAPEVVVVRTGTANLASVLAALHRAGAKPVLSHDPAVVRDATHAVLPGVGAFAAAMDGLRADGLVDVLADRIAARRATLAICLGLQLFGEGSEESPHAAGLAVLPFRARLFRGDQRVPHLGWNHVEPDPECELLSPGHAYFAHSYFVADAPAEWCAGRTEYGERFVAALERGPVLACQFHPELSGAWGLDLLRRWIARGGESC
jgi:imidazole glycerol phosphate synthase glutamine amidotransferase subunit